MTSDELDIHTREPAEERVRPPEAFVEQANIQDTSLYETFDQEWPTAWARAGDTISWDSSYDHVFDEETSEWFVGGQLNAATNCLDRHLDERKNQRALVWEGLFDERRTFTYLELTREVEAFAATLRELGVEEGDVVTIHMPMVPELPIAMLACARIGAIHSVVYVGFSADSLTTRMAESGSNLLVTCDGYYQRGGAVSLKNKTDRACLGLEHEVTTIVVDRLGEAYEYALGPNDFEYESLRSTHYGTDIEPVSRAATDTLFLIYTSGTTGRPKRVTQTTGGYLSYVTWTSHATLDLKPSDTYWCTADIGWITGHSYLVYGPLSVGATVVLHEGRPEYPSKTRPWEVIERNAVDILYTSPSTVRTLMKRGDSYLEDYDCSSLRLLGTVGEPINPRVWRWFYEAVGNEECPIVDTWWQTETGGHLIATLPGVTDMKPGAAGPPLPGISASVVDATGESVETGTGGYLVIDRPWPGMPQELVDSTRWASREKSIPVTDDWQYVTEDGALVDEDGYVTILGRVDDVIKVSGYRFGSMELESAIVAVEGVAEAAVVTGTYDDHERGLYAYVCLEDTYERTERIRKAIHESIERVVGPFARPDDIIFTAELPKTSSGKIVRRVLTDLASGNELGDTSSLRNPEIVGELESATRDD